MKTAPISSWLRKNGANVALQAGVNFVLPYVIFSIYQPKIGDARALLASSIPPILWSIVEFVRNRKIDALSLLVIAGIALSLLAFVGGGSVKFLQLRENLVNGLIGLVFLGSVVIGKPLIYQLARAGMQRKPGQSDELAKFEQLRDKPGFKRSMVIMTLVWGWGFVGATAVACALVFLLPIKTYLIVGPIVGNGIVGLIALWTFWYVRESKRRGAEAAKAARVTPSGVEG